MRPRSWVPLSERRILPVKGQRNGFLAVAGAARHRRVVHVFSSNGQIDRATFGAEPRALFIDEGEEQVTHGAEEAAPILGRQPRTERPPEAAQVVAEERALRGLGHVECLTGVAAVELPRLLTAQKVHELALARNVIRPHLASGQRSQSERQIVAGDIGELLRLVEAVVGTILRFTRAHQAPCRVTEEAPVVGRERLRVGDGQRLEQ